MLIIGHRGATDSAPENTLEALQAGFESGADILEFDVRITADAIPILAHDTHLHGMRISQSTFAELETIGTVTTLESVLACFFGKIILNLEFKPSLDAKVVYELISHKFIDVNSDWGNIIISSFQVRALQELRDLNPIIQLALLHRINPYVFIKYQRRLGLTAVGWHYLHVDSLSIAIAKRARIFTYAYTVNRRSAAHNLEQRGIEGIVTDYPTTMRTEA